MRPVTQVETLAPVVVATPELAPESVVKREEIEEPMDEGEASAECLEIATEDITQVRIHSHYLLLLSEWSADICYLSACITNLNLWQVEALENESGATPVPQTKTEEPMETAGTESSEVQPREVMEDSVTEPETRVDDPE